MLTAERDRLIEEIKNNKSNWHEVLDSNELEGIIRIFSGEFKETVPVADPQSGRVVQKEMIIFEHSRQEIFDRVTASEKYRQVLKGK
jgi:hypothetical protein